MEMRLHTDMKCWLLDELATDKLAEYVVETRGLLKIGEKSTMVKVLVGDAFKSRSVTDGAPSQTTRLVSGSQKRGIRTHTQ